MYIFSQPKRDIKREINEFGKTTQDSIVYNKLIKRVDSLEQIVHLHSKQLNQLEQVLIAAACTKLTEKQRIILNWLITNYDDDEVYTNLIKQLSNDLSIPESTVRWNLRGLRDAELINAGTKDNKGIPVSLTMMGRIMANYTYEQ